MKIDHKAIRRAAGLAKLRLTEGEIFDLVEEVTPILNSLLDTEVGELANECFRMTHLGNQELREDEADSFKDTKALFQNTVREKDGHIAVSRVLDME